MQARLEPSRGYHDASFSDLGGGLGPRHSRLLDVGAVVEGSVRVAGHRLRVMTQLVNVDDCVDGRDHSRQTDRAGKGKAPNEETSVREFRD